MFAGTKPSKVAARLSLADWLLVVLLGTGTSVSPSMDALTAATVALVRAFIIGDMVARLILLSRMGRQFVDGYFYVISSEWLCDDGGVVGSEEGTLGICWTMAEFAAIAKGRWTER